MTEVVVMSGWLIVFIVLAVALLFYMAMRHRGGGRRSSDLVGGDGTRNVGERWRTGGYDGGGGGS